MDEFTLMKNINARRLRTVGVDGGLNYNYRDMDANQPATRRKQALIRASTMRHSKRGTEAFTANVLHEKLGPRAARSARTKAKESWLQYFDDDGSGCVELEEFEKGMAEMGFVGDIAGLFRDIDRDDSGEVTLEEIANFGKDLWNAFKRWCAAAFATPSEMVAKLSRGGTFRNASVHDAPASGRKQRSRTAEVTLFQFTDAAIRLGWYGSFEPLLFRHLDVRGVGAFSVPDLDWFWSEYALHQKRIKYRAKFARAGAVKLRSPASAIRALQCFASFLKTQFGCIFRGWREVLDTDGSMTVQRKELLKACSDLGWYGDTAALWHALDHEELGYARLEDLSTAEARILALFKQWYEKKYRNSEGVFWAIVNGLQKARAGDSGFQRQTTPGKVTKKRERGFKLKETDWMQGLEYLDYPHDAMELFPLLDWEYDGHLTASELKFLDDWKYSEWLVVKADEKAAADLKLLLIETYGHVVKAWKEGLDRQSAGKISVKDFLKGCDRVGFNKNRLGAWMAFDVHVMGFITLHEFDHEAAGHLAEFRRWTFNSLGGAMLAFKEMDKDDSNSLTLREFKHATRQFGFRGDVNRVFDALNIDGLGQISRTEASFVDDWELDLMPHRSAKMTVELASLAKSGLPGMLAGKEVRDAAETINQTSALLAATTGDMSQHKEWTKRWPRRGLPNGWTTCPGEEGRAPAHEDKPKKREVPFHLISAELASTYSGKAKHWANMKAADEAHEDGPRRGDIWYSARGNRSLMDVVGYVDSGNEPMQWHDSLAMHSAALAFSEELPTGESAMPTTPVAVSMLSIPPLEGGGLDAASPMRSVAPTSPVSCASPSRSRQEASAESSPAAARPARSPYSIPLTSIFHVPGGEPAARARKPGGAGKPAPWRPGRARGALQASSPAAAGQSSAREVNFDSI
eukprot:TRINITY_DN25199_c0_g1_i1.p1 TRINITY_DN25199_c0_g1~~TRINITY_DN25199_c0_g1_i1.p1  ORF type:complete len:916 (+),score=241.34 TRINITY_DN25199_c0_g1_i1:203-2950(+)